MLHLKKYAESEIEIKKSRFIGMLFPVENEQEARDYLAMVRKQHPNASHHCTALICGNIQHSNDDGEPSGTAGLPMLECLRHENLDNVLAVVVRYFGGTLLGTGGLLRAYQQAVNETIKKAVFTQPVEMMEYKVTVSYDLYNKIDQMLRKNAIITDTDFDNEITIHFLCLEDLTQKFQAMSSGLITPVFIKKSIIEKEISSNQNATI
ncbi:MAG: YigZ family protein [Erysipelotrichaceae bacterium]|nr:YigZ family protein [Erysipelotrichaceae bacterium]